MQRRSEGVLSRNSDTDDRAKGEASRCRRGPKASAVEVMQMEGSGVKMQRRFESVHSKSGDTDDKWKAEASRCRRSESVRSREW